MTLVQSLRQPLSGNNLLIILFLIVSISSCSAQKITSSKNTETIEVGSEKKKKSKKEKEVVAIQVPQNTPKEDSILKKPVVFDLDKALEIRPKSTSDYPVKKDPNRIHNIAVILPFNLNQIPLGLYVDDSTKQLSTESKNAVEFYLGCQMAKDKFRSDKLKSNVYFVDDRNDSSSINELFYHRPFPDVEYIIGPVNYSSVKKAAELAKEYKIPLISPFANSMYFTDNPFYFNANASLRSQYAFILTETKKRFPDKIIEIIYDESDQSSENISILKEIADKFYVNGKTTYRSLNLFSNIENALTTKDTINERVILIYSSKENYVKSIIAKLKPIKNQLHIFTSSCIRNTKAAIPDAKYPHSVYTVYPYNTDSPNLSAFTLKFTENYDVKPSETAAHAYDIMMHLFNMMEKEQTLQNNIYQYTTDFDNTQSKFDFRPVLNKNGEIDYFDNTIMYLYKYVNGNFIPETP